MSTAPHATAPETPDLHGAYPRLDDQQIAALTKRGRRRSVSPGDILFREGDQVGEFLVVLSGKVAMVESYGDGDPDDDAQRGDGKQVLAGNRTIAVHGTGRFLGELSLLTGQASFVTAVVLEPGEVLAVPADEVRMLVAGDQALGDLILRAYLARRTLLIRLGAGFRIIGSRYSAEARRLCEFAARNRLPHRWIDLEADEEADRLLRQLGITPQETPVVIWHSRRVLRNPTVAELAETIGLPTPADGDAVCDLVIVGAGPGGLAAAVYAASEGLSTIVLDAVAAGGQASTSSRIENYLGFPSGISGAELAERAAFQAGKFGARLTVPAEATALEPHDGYYGVVVSGQDTVNGHVVIIATGARYRRLNVPRLEEFEGAGVYYAATPFELRMCRGEPVVIVGGGNSAGQAALFLAESASGVRMLVRGDDLRSSMSRYLADEVERAPGVEILYRTEVRELLGEQALRAVRAENTRTGESFEIETRTLFVFIGADPHTKWLEGVVPLDDRGFVVAGKGVFPPAQGWDSLPPTSLPLETERLGVFAVGDVRSGSVKRVASAVGEGAMAVRLVHERFTADQRRGR
ncbi:FAD-dependent oxidoreductase [Thermoactinospora rubra]|uniref:FAD-dependent oxidoreductase n=1 Tax=Thermoactinospora rubra TaxID=1088767 RepID=UPI000A118B6B|nr:FAD-dependent oxidoreductase [Thermoactinospora rubra]